MFEDPNNVVNTVDAIDLRGRLPHQRRRSVTSSTTQLLVTFFQLCFLFFLHLKELAQWNNN
jgi:hypothetical protein